MGDDAQVRIVRIVRFFVTISVALRNKKEHNVNQIKPEQNNNSSEERTMQTEKWLEKFANVSNE